MEPNVQAGAVFVQECNVAQLQLGAPYSTLTVEGKRGVRCVRACFTVLADGAASNLASTAGFQPPERDSIGFAIRGYFEVPSGLEDWLHVYAPLADPQTPGIAGYAWVFPLSKKLANIGLGFFPTTNTKCKPNVRHLLARFLEDLTQRDPKFELLTLKGTLRGGRLPCGFNANGCQHLNGLLVGDAAGLANPFTGEGINGALASGRIAADILDEALSGPQDNKSNLLKYGAALNKRFGDQFRAGRRFLNTYEFLWKVLDETFHIDSALFNGLRRAAMDLGDVQTSAPDSSRCITNLLNHFGLVEQREMLTHELSLVLRSENPLLSRVARYTSDVHGCALRLILLSVSSARSDGVSPKPLVTLSTMIELLQLSIEVHRDVRDAAALQTQPRSGTRWANRFAVSAGNWLLVQAYRTLSSFTPDLVSFVARASAKCCGGELGASLCLSNACSESDSLYRIERTTGRFFEMCCTVGAHWGGLASAEEDVLGRCGFELGVGYELLREVERSDEKFIDNEHMSHLLEQGNTPFAVAWTLRHRPMDRLDTILSSSQTWSEKQQTVQELLWQNGAMDEVSRQADLALARARLAADQISNPVQRRAMLHFIDALETYNVAS